MLKMPNWRSGFDELSEEFRQRIISAFPGATVDFSLEPADFNNLINVTGIVNVPGREQIRFHRLMSESDHVGVLYTWLQKVGAEIEALFAPYR